MNNNINIFALSAIFSGDAMRRRDIDFMFLKLLYTYTIYVPCRYMLDFYFNNKTIYYTINYKYGMQQNFISPQAV